MLQPGPAPGRDPGGTPAAPPPPSPGGAPSEGAPGAPAPAQPPPQGGLLGNISFLLPLLLMVAVLFFMTRSDKKKRAQIEQSLKKGDRIVTRSGIIGKLTEVGERTARVEIAPGVNVTILKATIEGLDPGDVGSSTAAKDAKEAPKDGKDDDKKKK